MKRKNIKYIAISIIIIAIFFIACDKTGLIDPKNESEFECDLNFQINYAPIQKVQKIQTGVNASMELLKFDDMRSFLFTLSELERQTSELDDAFVEKYSDLTEEEIDDKEEEINFNEDKLLIDFERETRFSSLREKIDIEVEEFLNQEEPDWYNDPDDHFIDEPSLRTLLNTDSEIQIGNIIYKFIENGYFEITDGNLNTLSMLDNCNNIDYNSLPDNVNFIGDNLNGLQKICGSSCSGWKRNADYKKYGDKRIKWIVKIRTWPWGRYVNAKTVNYKKKKKWWGTYWKKYRTFCIAQVYGKISGASGDCTDEVVFNTADGAFEAENHKKRVKHTISVSTKTSSDWVKGYHKGAGGITKDSSLDW